MTWRNTASCDSNVTECWLCSQLFQPSTDSEVSTTTAVCLNAPKTKSFPPDIVFLFVSNPPTEGQLTALGTRVLVCSKSVALNRLAKSKHNYYQLYLKYQTWNNALALPAGVSSKLIWSTKPVIRRSFQSFLTALIDTCTSILAWYLLSVRQMGLRGGVHEISLLQCYIEFWDPQCVVIV